MNLVIAPYKCDKNRYMCDLITDVKKTTPVTGFVVRMDNKTLPAQLGENFITIRNAPFRTFVEDAMDLISDPFISPFSLDQKDGSNTVFIFSTIKDIHSLPTLCQKHNWGRLFRLSFLCIYTPDFEPYLGIKITRLNASSSSSSSEDQSSGGEDDETRSSGSSRDHNACSSEEDETPRNQGGSSRDRNACSSEEEDTPRNQGGSSEEEDTRSQGGSDISQAFLRLSVNHKKRVTFDPHV
jgi:hypothetical protein